MSGEDLAANLRNYLIQLQQAEAALAGDPENEELLKLKCDLEEVIMLTKNLMAAEGALEEEAETDVLPQNLETKHNFESGDIVMAPWSTDGQFYEAEIEDIMSDGQCNVIFSSLPNGKTKVSEVCLVTLLKPVQGSKKKMKIDTTGFGTISRGPKGLRSDDASSSSQLNSKQKRMQIQQHRDYLKKKQQKKQNRIKELEEEREKEKSKWQQFNQKAMNKHLKGASSLAKKKSIFKSPDTVEGKVGVGTCGIAGKPMTNFVVADKYKRGTSAASSSSSTPSSLTPRYPNLHSTVHQHKYK